MIQKTVRPFIAAAIVWVQAVVPGSARGEVQDWQVNEILTHAGGDGAVRYVELWNQVGGCLFPTSQLRVYDAAGQLLDQVSPVAATTCFGPDTYFLFATPAAASRFDTTADEQILPSLPADAGQVCFASSATRYDCARWGAIETAVVDLFGPDDQSSAEPPGDAVALARVATTHVVAVDFALAEPTPRGPNDGGPWYPPDAGPTPDAAPAGDAAPIPDGGPIADAWTLFDAGPRVDASGQRYLDMDPQGGATCSCRVGRRGDPAGSGLLALLVIGWLAAGGRRRRGGRADD